ncbi:sulfur oxidation c-type cytochrome SoxX [Thioalkalivibrio sp. ALgr1]|uniref:sulfur oxidation c-type cytochrome SoxX n=1 Tax=Thioalkalivibrio sp. ALgr1 TaxID=748655 RepID=UPI00036C4D2E|nr:sulfur oxidation c-type cytochrome SoxX [Thioalkalivibrio sp. ALgr1]
MFKKKNLTAAVVVSASAALAGCDQFFQDASDREVDITQMSPEELAEHLVLETDSYRMDQEVQEGGTGRERMQQDEVQALCSLEGSPDSETAGQVVAAARASYERPDGGVELGDWRRGAELARSGYGYRVGHNNDDHGTREPGANCYACHQMDPAETTYGTIGPSLANYGRERGTDESVLNYVHEVVSNPHQYFPCTYMPRFGRNFLTEEQISHVMAYLLDPESPVNQ